MTTAASVDNNSVAPEQITVIGLGLLGTSLALALRKAGYAGKIYGLSHRDANAEAARCRGCFDLVSLQPEQVLPDSNMVIVTTPLSAVENSYRLIANHCATETVVTDAGSTKQSVAEAAFKAFGEVGARRCIGAHPMAGGEQSGPEAGRADLFANKPCVLTLGPNDLPHAVTLAQWLWRDMLQMHLLELSPQEHDRAVASVSHLPHLASAAIMLCAGKLGGLEVASSGFADTTRIAAGSPELWRDIFSHNSQAVLEASQLLRATLLDFEAKLSLQQDPEILEFLEQAATLRRSWERRPNP